MDRGFAGSEKPSSALSASWRKRRAQQSSASIRSPIERAKLRPFSSPWIRHSAVRTIEFSVTEARSRGSLEAKASYSTPRTCCVHSSASVVGFILKQQKHDQAGSTPTTPVSTLAEQENARTTRIAEGFLLLRARALLDPKGVRIRLEGLDELMKQVRQQ